MNISLIPPHTPTHLQWTHARLTNTRFSGCCVVCTCVQAYSHATSLTSCLIILRPPCIPRIGFAPFPITRSDSEKKLFRIVRKCGAWQSVFGVPIEIGKTSDKSIEIYKTKSIKKMHKCGRGSFGRF